MRERATTPQGDLDDYTGVWESGSGRSNEIRASRVLSCRIMRKRKERRCKEPATGSRISVCSVRRHGIDDIAGLPVGGRGFHRFLLDRLGQALERDFEDLVDPPHRLDLDAVADILRDVD
jgi:hypothetical protein